MTGLPPGLPVDTQVVCPFGHVEAAEANENRVSRAPHLGESLPRRGSHADGRVRLLERLGDDGEVFEVVILPLIGEALLRPGLDDDLQTLLKALPALRVGNAIPFIG